MPREEKIRVAAVQMKVSGDQMKNMKRIRSFIKMAAQRRVEVVNFPECALTGYPSRGEYADLSSMDEIDREALDKNLEEVGQLAQRHRIWVFLGTARYREEAWHNDALLISDKGEIEGVYSKVNLTEEDEQYFASGSSFPIMKVKEVPVGVQICFDMRFPENWRILKMKGAKVIFHLAHASKSDTWKIPVLEGTMRTRAAENGLFVVSANDAGPLQMMQSVIVNPKGLILAQANMDMEEMITADLHLKEVNDDFFKRRRTDLYDFKLKE